MGNLGGPEILVILLVALMVLGPNKLPEAARQLGKAVTELRRMSSGFQQEMRDAMVDPELEQQARDLRKNLKDPFALKENLLSNSTPPKSRPALGADPTPPTESEESPRNTDSDSDSDV